MKQEQQYSTKRLLTHAFNTAFSQTYRQKLD